MWLDGFKEISAVYQSKAANTDNVFKVVLVFSVIEFHRK